MKIWLTLLIFLISSSSFAQLKCATLMAMSPQKQTVTQSFIAYLEALLERRIIGDVALRHLIDGSDPIPDQVNIPSQLLVHRGEIHKYLSNPSFNRTVLLEWLKTTLSARTVALNQRDVTKQATEDPYQKIVFQRVNPGRFKFKYKRIRLTHTFEMMSTPVTQIQFARLMGNNPAAYRDGTDSTSILIGDVTITLKPDHPVDSVSWYDAVGFANRMSELAGLKPAYDLSNSPAGHPTINAPGGNIYDTEGYRLPTTAEFQYVASAARPYTSSFDSLKLIAWGSSTAEGSTKPVAQLKPILVNGQSFFDIYGNLSHWTHDSTEGPIILKGTDPVNLIGSRRVIRGSSYIDDVDFIRTLNYLENNRSPTDIFSYVGFRLVRTLK